MKEQTGRIVVSVISCSFFKIWKVKKKKKPWQIWTAASSQSEPKAAPEPADKAGATPPSTQGPLLQALLIPAKAPKINYRPAAELHR